MTVPRLVAAVLLPILILPLTLAFLLATLAVLILDRLSRAVELGRRTGASLWLAMTRKA